MTATRQRLSAAEAHDIAGEAINCLKQSGSTPATAYAGRKGICIGSHQRGLEVVFRRIGGNTIRMELSSPSGTRPASLQLHALTPELQAEARRLIDS